MRRILTVILLLFTFIYANNKFNSDILIKKGVYYYQHYNYKKAFKIWNQLAKKQNPIGINNLAMAYYTGTGVQPDQAKAVSILTNYLKNHNNTRIMLTLALMLYQGYYNNFTKKIYVKRKSALILLKKAAKQNNKKAKQLLKQLYTHVNKKNNVDTKKK